MVPKKKRVSASSSMPKLQPHQQSSISTSKEETEQRGEGALVPVLGQGAGGLTFLTQSEANHYIFRLYTNTLTHTCTSSNELNRHPHLNSHWD